MGESLYHLVPASEWGSGYRPESLEREGFVHCSTHAQLAATLALYFEPDAAIIAVELSPNALGSRLRWESVPGRDAPMPHLYAAIEEAAIIAIHALRHDGERWLLPRIDPESG